MRPGAWGIDWFRLIQRPGRIVTALALLCGLKGLIYLAFRAGAFGPLDNGFAFVTLSAKYSVFLISFFITILAAFSIAGEYNHGLLRMNLARPVGRGAYFLQRASFLTLLAFLLLLFDAGAGALIGWGGFGFSDVADVRLQGPQFSAGALAWDTIKAYLLTFLGTAGLAALGMLISLFFKTPAAALGTGAAVFLVMEGGRIVFREPVAYWLLTHYTGIHLEKVGELTRGIAGYTPPETLILALCVPTLYFAASLLIGIILFRKRDILA
jgi:ABC-type transport system involved in multi-copper enzyme maturation permease subunit